MSYITIFLIAIGLAMDAFAVSVTSGITIKKMTLKYPIIFGLYFGGFQLIMPIIGFLCGKFFANVFLNYSHIVSFILLAIIGGKMIYESFNEDESSDSDNSHILNYKNMAMLALATSIDALAVGVTFALSNVNIITASIIIGLVAFVFSFFGVILGKNIGGLFKKNAEIIGGLILIGIGLKILISYYL